jgi:hypothetical protein
MSLIWEIYGSVISFRAVICHYFLKPELKGSLGSLPQENDSYFKAQFRQLAFRGARNAT